MEAHICQPVCMPVTVLHNIVVLCSWAVSGLDIYWPVLFASSGVANWSISVAGEQSLYVKV